METVHEDLLALTENEVLAEVILELRQNTEAVENLQDIAADIHDWQKQETWDRNPW